MTTQTRPSTNLLDAAIVLFFAATSTRDIGIIDPAADMLCDAIIMDAANIDPAKATRILRIAEAHDPTYSMHGALIRDTLRDNTDLILR